MATKIITQQELSEHTKKDNVWLLVRGKVYNVAKFIDEHPGGEEVILNEAGKDATDAYDDVGHSDEANALLPGMLVGDFETGAGSQVKNTSTPSSQAAEKAVQTTSNAMYFVPLAVLTAYFAWRFYS